MDRAWMKQRLEKRLELSEQLEFLDELDERQVEDDEIDYLDSLPPRPAIESAILRAEPTVLEIFRAVDPNYTYLQIQPFFNQQKPYIDRANLERAIALVEDQVEWAIRLAPDAPSLIADQFHPWVWSAAQSLWESRRHRLSVLAAAISVTANTQTKVGRSDVADDELMAQVFTGDSPKPGKSRLRLPGDHTDQTVKSRQRALLPFAQGCYAGIRNLAAHEHGPDWTEQRALQSLACLSILAGWIEECEVVHHSDA